MSLLRLALSQLLRTTARFSDTDTEVVASIVDYFNRVTERSSIREMIKLVYGSGVRKEADPQRADSEGYEIYAKDGFSTLVDNGVIEAISVGFGHKIINAHATQFTERGQRYSLTHDTIDGDGLVDANELLQSERKAGGYQTAMVMADKISIECGTGIVLMTYGARMDYQYLNPSQIKAMYHDVIEDNDQARAPDRREVEDAAYIIIKQGVVPSDVNKYYYLAIFGRSEDYPMGRWVTYQANDTVEVPAVGELGTIDYMIDNEPANPLTYYGVTQNLESFPEYPIAVIRSGLTDANDTPFPVTSSLYHSCRNFSTAASHQLSKSQENVSGAKVVSIINDEGKGKPLPRSLSGNVSLLYGQQLDLLHNDASSVEQGYLNLKNLMIDTAASYSVPDYMVVSEDYTLNASSGIALQVKTRPLKKFREFRVELNVDQVAKIFEIEKAFIFLSSVAEDATINTLVQCTQMWDAGELRLPENKKEVADRCGVLMDRGIMDTIAAIMDYYQIPDEAEAIEFYERMSDRNKDYPPIVVNSQKKTVGLLRTTNVLPGKQQ